jgi:hypothetical protein
MAEQMTAPVQQAGDRAAAEATRVVSAGGGDDARMETPIPQTVSAPGIDTASPIVRTEVIPPNSVGNGLGPKAVPGEARSRERGYSGLVVGGYVGVAVGFALVFVVPRFKSELWGKSLLVLCAVLLLFGAISVVLGFVRETIRRL